MKNLTNIIAASGCFNIEEALRAVVEIHIPEGTLVHRCQEDKKPWPCQTIKTIEKELTKE
jgi:hypothetical protein